MSGTPELIQLVQATVARLAQGVGDLVLHASEEYDQFCLLLQELVDLSMGTDNFFRALPVVALLLTVYIAVWVPCKAKKLAAKIHAAEVREHAAKAREKAARAREQAAEHHTAAAAAAARMKWASNGNVREQKD